MPSRVIDVGPLDGSVEPRLHQSQGESGQWTTLSHCWGKKVTTRLTLATLEDNMTIIPIATPSQNFRDVIARHRDTRHSIRFGLTAYALFRIQLKTGCKNRRRWEIFTKSH